MKRLMVAVVLVLAALTVAVAPAMAEGGAFVSAGQVCYLAMCTV